MSPFLWIGLLHKPQKGELDSFGFLPFQHLVQWKKRFKPKILEWSLLVPEQPNMNYVTVSELITKAGQVCLASLRVVSTLRTQQSQFNENSLTVIRD